MTESEAVAFPSASVVIVCYNEMQFLDGCLTALLCQDYPGEYEVLLVDNASTDGSGDYVRTYFPVVRLIEPGANLGFAKGNNYGAQFAEGQVIAFLNCDTRVTGPEWLRELVRPLVDDATIGLTTSKIVLMDQPDRINACGLDVSLSGIATCRHAGRATASVVDDEEVAAISGGAFAIRASLFQKLGGFDRNIFIYQEDTDLSWRARLAGYRCVLAARSVVAHSYTFKLPPKKARDIERTRYLMLAKNLSLLTLIALLPLLLLSEVITWGWAALKGPRYLAAKAQAVFWTISHPRHLIRAHRETQRLRRVADTVVLRTHISIPAINSVSDGPAARAAMALLAPLASGLAVVAFWFIAMTNIRAEAGN
jgi:GT2 family glycosyltransferase